MSKVSEGHKECGLSPVNKGKQSSLQFRFRVEKSYTDSLASRPKFDYQRKGFLLSFSHSAYLVQCYND